MKRTVAVTRYVDVKVDESKFTPEWMEAFRRDFYEFYTVEDHVRHIAQLAAREMIYNDSFIEGYGLANEMGIKVTIEDLETDIVL